MKTLAKKVWFSYLLLMICLVVTPVAHADPAGPNPTADQYAGIITTPADQTQIGDLGEAIPPAGPPVSPVLPPINLPVMQVAPIPGTAPSTDTFSGPTLYKAAFEAIRDTHILLADEKAREAFVKERKKLTRQFVPCWLLRSSVLTATSMSKIRSKNLP